MRSRSLPLVALGLSLSLACDDSGQIDMGDGSGGDGALVLGTLDPRAHCDMVGAIEVELRAELTGCVNGPPAPCTLPNPPKVVVGDGVTCPTSQSTVTLGVDVTFAGRYRVYPVTIFTDLAEAPGTCFAEQGSLEIVVDTEAIEQGAELQLSPTSQHCAGE